jgi:hypothetical protein
MGNAQQSSARLARSDFVAELNDQFVANEHGGSTLRGALVSYVGRGPSTAWSP